MTEVCVRPADRALPRSFFTIRRTLDDIPGANRADRFALYGGLWHWHEYNDENPNGIEIEVTDTLRECARGFARRYERGAASSADFFVHPRSKALRLKVRKVS